jgi:hypothetical protein
MIKSAYTRAAYAVLAFVAFAGEAVAMGNWRQVQHAPEIDGPAGVAAIALLVSAGIVAYNRLRR